MANTEHSDEGIYLLAASYLIVKNRTYKIYWLLGEISSNKHDSSRRTQEAMHCVLVKRHDDQPLKIHREFEKL